MTLARHIAERIVAMRADNLPPAAMQWSKVAVMDTLGVALAVLARVHAAPHLDGQFEPEQDFAAEVKITLRDGRAFAARVLRPLDRRASV